MASMNTFSRLSSACVQPSCKSSATKCVRTDWQNLKIWVGLTNVISSLTSSADVLAPIDVSSGFDYSSGVRSFLIG